MRALAASIGAAALLIGIYLALGGASYAPAEVADPCAPRDWTEPRDLEEVGEEIVLSALDGTACELGVSREEIVLAFEDRATLERFARENGVDDRDVERLVKAGFVRAVDDAEAAGALTPEFASALRELYSNMPVADVIRLLDEVVG
jgi:hypothetical protein